MQRTLLLLMLVSCACFAAAALPEKPNVLLVLTDDQGYGDLSCHGNPVLKTPNLDKLHSESIRFTDYHVAPMCTPTRGELLTGKQAFRNGAVLVCQGKSMIRRGIPTMADMFKAAGYATGHFGKWHLGDNYPYRPQDRGFDETVHHGAWGITSMADYWDNDYFDDTYEHNGKPEKHNGYWDLHVAASGTYEIALYGCPKATNAAFGEEFTHVPGRPVSSAKLIIGDKELTTKITPQEKCAVFTVSPKTGDTPRLQSQLYDARGKDLGGSYFVYIMKR